MIVDAKGLTKVFKSVLAVDHVSFGVTEGEIYGFLGPNGAGKTTTINMLTTLMRPTEGMATIDGFDTLREADAVRAVIGLVPQDLTVDDDLSGLDNLLIQSRLYGVPKDTARKRISELVKLVDLQDAITRQVKTYSGGMRKRLELITGLIHQPRVLFLDEPTLGLDVQTRNLMWEHIKRLNRQEKITIFITTHYMDEADRLCDRIGIIDKGQIVKIGTPKELKDALGGDIIEIALENGSEDVSSLISSIPLVAHVKRDNNIYRIKVSRGEEALPTIFETVLKFGRRVNSVSLTKPTLDQVFLEHTGKSLRDAQQGAEDARMAVFRLKKLRS